jgi:hypothetical protein
VLLDDLRDELLGLAPGVEELEEVVDQVREDVAVAFLGFGVEGAVLLQGLRILAGFLSGGRGTFREVDLVGFPTGPGSSCMDSDVGIRSFLLSLAGASCDWGGRSGCSWGSCPCSSSHRKNSELWESFSMLAALNMLLN